MGLELSRELRPNIKSDCKCGVLNAWPAEAHASVNIPYTCEHHSELHVTARAGTARIHGKT